MRSRCESTRASEHNMRRTSCSLAISSEKMPTVSPVLMDAYCAMLRHSDVFPIAGRAATMMRSPFCRPLVFSSRSTKPVGIPVTSSLDCESWSMVRKLSLTISRIPTKPWRMRCSAMSKMAFSARSRSSAGSSSAS